MKTVSTELAELLNGYQFFVAELYTITLENGQSIRFTTGDGDIPAFAPINVSTPYTLLLHFNEYPVIDYSGHQHAITNEAGINSDLIFNGSCGDIGVGTVNDRRFTFVESAAFNFGFNDFTIRFRIQLRHSVDLKTHTLFSNGYGLTIDWYANTRKISVRISYDGVANQVVMTSDIETRHEEVVMSTTAVSVEVHQNKLHLYIDGKLACTPVLLTSPIYYQNGRTMAIGGTGSQSTWGYVDEFMIMNGYALAKGAAGYVVESVPYSNGVDYTQDTSAVRVERGDITIATGVEVNECPVTLYCNSETVLNGLTLPHFALIGGFDNALVKIELAIMSGYGEVINNELIHLFEGRTTDVKLDIAKVELTVGSDSVLLDTKIPGTVYQPSCKHTLYDKRCSINRNDFTESATVGTVSGDGSISFTSAKAAEFFTLGKMTFTSGVNTGLSRTIKTHTTLAGVAIVLPTAHFPNIPAVGDSFIIAAGCDKLRSTCTAKFNNAVHFLGWEYVPVPETSL